MVIDVESAVCSPTRSAVRCSARRTRVRCHRVRRLRDHAPHRLEVRGAGTRKREVDDGAGPAAREVADRADVAVGDDVESAVDAAEAGEAHRDVLDHPCHAADQHRVADVVLVLHRHEDAREVVAHDLLGAEAQCGADDGRAGQERRQVDAEHPEHDGAGDDEHEEPPDVCRPRPTWWRRVPRPSPTRTGWPPGWPPVRGRGGSPWSPSGRRRAPTTTTTRMPSGRTMRSVTVEAVSGLTPSLVSRW